MGLIKKLLQPVINKHRGKVGEKKVDKALNPLLFGKVEHRQLNNLILLDENGKSHQIDHVEIRANGIFCIETKSYIGTIYGDEYRDTWTQVLYSGQKNSLPNPLKQNKSHVYHLSRAIGKRYPIHSVVVMVNNNADTIPCSNVVNLEDLKGYLKQFDGGRYLTNGEMEQIYDKLLNAASGMSEREHIKNIKRTQKEFDRGVCPRCGGRLVERNGQYGEFYGCSNYPKCKFTLRKN